MKGVENEHVEATVLARIKKHLSDWHGLWIGIVSSLEIKIFNLDECGIYFRNEAGRWKRKGVGLKNENFITTIVQTKGNLNRVFIMGVVNAAGVLFKRFVVFSRRQTHFRKNPGAIQTVHTFLPECYIHYREKAGVDTFIYKDWAEKFIDETDVLRADRRNRLLLHGGNGCHIQLSVLIGMREAGVVVFAFPSHTSQDLQLLDVSVFGPFKCFVQKQIHKFARTKGVLDVFDLSVILSDSMREAFLCSNILSDVSKWKLE